MRGFSFPGRDAENLYGGDFWQAKQIWLDHAPLFNVDKVRTPALFTFAGPDTQAASVSEIMVAYKKNGRAADMLLFPSGTHWLQRPRERAASIQASVDWMNFWLQDREDAESSSPEQYIRWRRMRTDWQRQQAWEAAGNAVGSEPKPDFELPKVTAASH